MVDYDLKIPDIMIVRVPTFRAVTSGSVPWEVAFGAFSQWVDEHRHFLAEVVFGSADFLTGDAEKVEWVWRIRDEIQEADVAPYQVTEFQGGLYAVAVSIDGDGESHDKVWAKVNDWVATTNFIEDQSRFPVAHMIYVDEEIMTGLGYNQMNLYLPVKVNDADK